MKVVILLIVVIVIFLIYKTVITKQIITLKNGLGKLYCPYGPDIVCDYTRIAKIWEENIQDEFEKYVKPGDTVIDAGAYVGIHTIKLSKLVGPTGKVYAFEANPETFKVLEQNIKLNKLNNVRIFNKGLSDQAGFLSLKSHYLFNKGGDAWEDSGNEGTPTITIDSLNLAVDFMKIDVEGMESQVFEGMADTLTMYKPIIVFESFDSNHSKNCDILSRFGYKIKNIKSTEFGRNHDYVAIA
jgi:FkbM family methyltransferase